MAVRGVSDEVGLEQYIRDIQRFPILSAEEEYTMATRWQRDHDTMAAERLVTSHLRLVVSVAYEFKNYGIPMSDLIAEGNMGLMQAVKKFDPERGFRLTTYALWWIRAAIYETILNNWSIVKIGSSSNQKRLFFNLARAKRELGIMDNRLSNESVGQIANYLNVSESDVERMASRMGRDVSLNSPRGSGDDASEMIDNLAGDNITIDERLDQKELATLGAELLKNNMKKLTDREQDILKSRRLSDPVQTLEQLSEKYNISRERVRQIEERAFEKLQKLVLDDAENKKSLYVTDGPVALIEGDE